MKRQWRTEHKATTITTITTITITIIITIPILKRMKNVDTDNRGKKMGIVFCLFR
jgi:hypothetical protein